MDKRLKLSIHRYALWKAYNGKCFYCGNFIQTVYDLEEEHIIPQKYKKKPIELEKIIKDYKLWGDFDIDAYYNKVPTHSGCNGRKSFKLYRTESIHHYLNLAKEKVEKIQEIEGNTEKKALANDEVFKKGFDREAIEKFLIIIEEDYLAKQKNDDENLTILNLNREKSHKDQEKWQEFYNRMANADPKHLGIDIQHILNNKIRESDFEWVLKMNVGARGKYLKIYNNREWFFEFLNNRMGGNHYTIFIRDEITQQTYDFFKPDENKDILKKWLDYITEYCGNVEIIVRGEEVIVESHLLPSLNLAVFFDKGGTKQTIRLPIKSEKSKMITVDDIRREERKGYNRIEKKMEYDIYFRNNKEKKKEEAADITEQYKEYYKNRKINLFIFNLGNSTCNDIDLTIETIFKKSFKIRHKSQIQKPYVSSLTHLTYKQRNLIDAYEKVWELRRENMKEYPFEYEDLRIDKEEIGEETKWSIEYHIDYLRHNDSKPLEPIKIYIPEKLPTKELVFNCSFIQRESGTVRPQILKIILI